MLVTSVLLKWSVVWTGCVTWFIRYYWFSFPHLLKTKDALKASSWHNRRKISCNFKENPFKTGFELAFVVYRRLIHWISCKVKHIHRYSKLVKTTWRKDSALDYSQFLVEESNRENRLELRSLIIDNFDPEDVCSFKWIHSLVVKLELERKILIRIFLSFQRGSSKIHATVMVLCQWPTIMTPKTSENCQVNTLCGCGDRICTQNQV